MKLQLNTWLIWLHNTMICTFYRRRNYGSANGDEIPENMYDDEQDSSIMV